VQSAPSRDESSDLIYDRPVLTIDPGMHTGSIFAAAVDASGRFVVTGSDDKTVRVWSISDGKLLKTIRVPAGPGNTGKIYAVAISPDGDLVAAGGWTRITTKERDFPIYVFDRQTGEMAGFVYRLPCITHYLTFSSDGRYLELSHGVTYQKSCVTEQLFG
jgi:WD40 repeat protein